MRHDCPRRHPEAQDCEVEFHADLGQWRLYEPAGHTSFRIDYCPFCGVRLGAVDEEEAAGENRAAQNKDGSICAARAHPQDGTR